MEIQDYLCDREIYFHMSYNDKQLLIKFKKLQFQKTILAHLICDEIATGPEIIHALNVVPPSLNTRNEIKLIKIQVENVTIENCRNK